MPRAQYRDRDTLHLAAARARPPENLLQFAPVTQPPDDWLIRARELHRQATVIDTHMDTTQWLIKPDWNFAALHKGGHVDIPRLRSGGIDAIFLAVYVPGPMNPVHGRLSAKAQIARIHETVKCNAGQLLFARDSTDIRRAKAENRIAVLMGIEGGHLIEDSLEVLREYHADGAAYLTLTHAFHTTWADSSGVHESLAPRHGRLTAFGREVICEMNRLGIMVDVSHAGDATFWDALETSQTPVIASHSSCRALSPHRRNLSDEMMRAIAASGGVVQINFNARFVDPRFARSGEATAAEVQVTPMETLVNHFDHALQLIGPHHVGIGSDFDGVSALPRGMEDCSNLPRLTAALLQRGYSDAELIQVLGANVLRVMDMCGFAARARHDPTPSSPKVSPSLSP